MIAFACWDNRIAPVFDTAETLVLLEARSDSAHRRTESLPSGSSMQQIRMRLIEWDVDTLICGAISRPLFDHLTFGGMRVIPFVSGDLNEVIEAFCRNRLDSGRFSMPGCCHRRRRAAQGRGRHVRGNAGPGGECGCPACGYREPHESGIPCVERVCPNCRTALVRLS